MTIKKYFALSVLALYGCASGPYYKVPPIEISYDKLPNYWVASQPIVSKDHKIVSNRDMGCKVVYMEDEGRESSLYLDIKYTIDSKGKLYDGEVIAVSDGVDKVFVEWAKTFGLSPLRHYKAVNSDNVQPVTGQKRLYLVEDSETCENFVTDGYLHSNRTITITK